MTRRTVHRFAFGVVVAATLAGSMVGCKNKDKPKAKDADDVVVMHDPAPETDGATPTPALPSQTPAQAAANEPAPRELDPQTDPEEIDGWRPAWWLEDPMKTQQHATACAYATDAELSKARAIAVDYARQRLAQTLGHEPRTTEMKTDAIKLPSGEYRAFVLVQTPLK